MIRRRFHPRLLDSLHGYHRAAFGRDLAAGISVGIVALPLAMAFAIASGVKPEQGLVTAVIGGFLIAALGGSNVQIGGPAGAFIVVVYGIVERHGVANLMAATVLAGMLLFALGWMQLGSLVRYIPVPIVIGFTNGIAVLIALSQVKDLLGLSIDKLPADFFAQIGMLAGHAHTLNPWSLAIGLVCIVGLIAWPRLFGQSSLLPAALVEGRTMRSVSRLPGPIIALVTLTAAVAWLQLPVSTIGSRFGGIPQSLPALAWPDLSWAGAKELFIPTLTIALLGAIESLLCARIADNLTELPRHDPNQELMAQGLANVVVPFFGGIPATGTIARTVTNVRAGARTPIAGIVHAFTLLTLMLAAAPLAAHVPLAALAGILLVVAWNMGEWREFAHLRHLGAAHRVVMLGTFTLTVVFDLTVAVQVGLAMACGFFIYRMGTLFRVETDTADAAPPGVVVRRLHGSLFFGAATRLESVAEALPPGTHGMVLQAHRLISLDTSGLDALRQLHRHLTRQGVRLVVCELDDEPMALIRSSGFAATLGEGNIVPTMADACRLLQEPGASGA